MIAVARKQSEEVTAAMTEAVGPKCSSLHFVPFDLGKIDEIPGLLRRLRNEFGSFFGLVNNAALGHDGVLATALRMTLAASPAAITTASTSLPRLADQCVGFHVWRQDGQPAGPAVKLDQRQRCCKLAAGRQQHGAATQIHQLAAKARPAADISEAKFRVKIRKRIAALECFATWSRSDGASACAIFVDTHEFGKGHREGGLSKRRAEVLCKWLATANIFMAKDGVVITPTANGTFLSGITRARVIALLREAGLGVVETTLRYSDFQSADEISSTGNFTKVSPITRIDQRDLQLGPLYRRARELYWEFAHARAVRG